MTQIDHHVRRIPSNLIRDLRHTRIAQTVVDPANVPNKPSSPIMSKNLALGALIGLILGVGIAVFREIIIRKVHSREDILREVGVPLLGHLKKV